MSKDVASQPKTKLDSEIVIDSRWVKVLKDHYRSNGGDTLEYWLVDRTDSVIILVRQGGKFILGDKQLRPGVGVKTLDFAGGRVDGLEPLEAAKLCVQREFRLGDVVFPDPTKLTEPLFVDSAFSTQKVYGFYLEMPENVPLDGARYTAKQLAESLVCLQCRAMLLEWMLTQR
jgi:hypothetical protein